MECFLFLCVCFTGVLWPFKLLNDRCACLCVRVMWWEGKRGRWRDGYVGSSHSVFFSNDNSSIRVRYHWWRRWESIDDSFLLCFLSWGRKHEKCASTRVVDPDEHTRTQTARKAAPSIDNTLKSNAKRAEVKGERECVGCVPCCTARGTTGGKEKSGTKSQTNIPVVDQSSNQSNSMIAPTCWEKKGPGYIHWKGDSRTWRENAINWRCQGWGGY